MIERKRERKASTFYLYALFNAVTSATLIHMKVVSKIPSVKELSRLFLSVCPLQIVA